MEVLFFAAVLAACWTLSLTVLLPFFLLLKFSKPIRNRWFSWMFTKLELLIGPSLKAKHVLLRRRTFDLLKVKLESETKRNSPWEVLEIGMGSGSNLEFYPENCNLTALDMNETFETYLAENLKKYSHVTHKRTVIARAENMPQVEDSSMDVVVCTCVLCSVESIDAVLNEVKRVLKPGGKFLFIEHVAFPKNDWGYILQRLVSPLWRVYFNGCIPDRDIGAEIKGSGFSEVLCENLPTDTFTPLYYIKPLIIGLAIK